MAKAALKKKSLVGRLKQLVTAKRSGKPTAAIAKVVTTPKLTQKELEALRKRDVLIAEYMPYAASIAGKVCQGLSSVVEFDEVLCSARLGLLEAAKRFNDSLGIDFKTFAYYRIKGAIYDGLRKTGWIPRSLYARIKFEQATNEYLQFMAEKSGAVARSAGDEIGEVYDTVNSLASIYVISVDATEEGMELEDKKNRNVEQSAEFQQVKQYMKEAIESLPEKERKLVKMYYFQNRTLEEAGDELGLSKSWVSRLHARALEILFKKLGSRIKEGKSAPEAMAQAL